MKFFITNQKTLFEDEYIKSCTIQHCVDYFSNEKIIEVDTETEFCTWDINIDPLKRRLPDPYTSKVLTLQLGNRFNQFVIDCESVDFIPYVKPLFENPNILKIFTNAFFDLRFIFHWGINTKNICDIFLNEIILTRGLTKPKGYRSLGGMTERYLGIKLNKEVREEIQTRGLDTTVIMYASEDVRYMSRIKELQDVELMKQNLHKYAELESRYIISLARTSYKGFKLNKEKWLKVEAANKMLLRKYINDLDEWVIQNAPQKDTLFPICTIKWTSSEQVVPFMKSLGIDVEVPDKDKGGIKESVEIKLLLKQLDKSPILPLYIKFKEVSKELTTYGSKFLIKNLNPVTKKVHSEFYPILDTGRISSNKPNIQNIPGEQEGHTHPLRLAFEPFHDVFIVADYSQQEPIVNVVNSLM
jgi:DNA polymerase I-like protein with 3'-5' exonuclease and polymerase domains